MFKSIELFFFSPGSRSPICMYLSDPYVMVRAFPQPEDSYNASISCLHSDESCTEQFRFGDMGG